MDMDGILLPYQSRWLADKSQVKVCEKSRRIGLTWAQAADDVLLAASASGMEVLYISFNQDMTREYIDACGEWAKRFDAGVRSLGEEVLKDGDEREIKAFRIDFAGGNKILALSSRPSNLRGKQGRVVIDEAAFVDDLGEILKAALALLMWGGQVVVISTHNGADNAFNELAQDALAQFDQARISTLDSFCASLVRGASYRYGIAGDFRVDDKELADIAGETAVET
jgi:phage FluMu gp28-like protein